MEVKEQAQRGELLFIRYRAGLQAVSKKIVPKTGGMFEAIRFTIKGQKAERRKLHR